MHRKDLVFVLAGLLLVVVSGCGSVRHQITLRDNYLPPTAVRIEVGQATNATGQTFDVNVEQMLTDALTERLRNEDLLWVGPGGQRLVLVSKIVEYEKGDAFKRWLLPGWGATVLSIRSDLRDGNQLVGSAEARRTVSFGGGYTIGAWRTIFADLAGDVVSDLRAKIPK
jgi:hypothetical protein